jgi:hypothetical protein
MHTISFVISQWLHKRRVPIFIAFSRLLFLDEFSPDLLQTIWALKLAKVFLSIVDSERLGLDVR